MLSVGRTVLYMHTHTYVYIHMCLYIFIYIWKWQTGLPVLSVGRIWYSFVCVCVCVCVCDMILVCVWVCKCVCVCVTRYTVWVLQSHRLFNLGCARREFSCGSCIQKSYGYTCTTHTSPTVNRNLPGTGIECPLGPLNQHFGTNWVVPKDHGE